MAEQGDGGIAWCDRTWNPVVGCTQVSPGCDRCYAKTLHDMRHRAVLAGKNIAAKQYAKPFETVQLMPDRLKQPLSWLKPQRVFVNSVRDLFHADVPDAFLDQVFAVMALSSRHTHQVLTKRAGRMRSYIDGLADRGGNGRGFRRLEKAARSMGYTMEWEGRPMLSWPIPNVWLGVSVENRATLSRLSALRQTAAAVRFVSFEPLLESVKPDLTGIQWAIVGGESGKGARPFDLTWARELIAQCRAFGTAPFMKQLGAHPHDVDAIGRSVCRSKTRCGQADWDRIIRDRHGGDMAEWPADLRVREWPTRAVTRG